MILKPSKVHPYPIVRDLVRRLRVSRVHIAEAEITANGGNRMGAKKGMPAEYPYLVDGPCSLSYRFRAQER
jgi:hypothetical protein